MSPDLPKEGFLRSTGDTSYETSFEMKTGEKLVCRYDRKNNIENVEVDAPYDVTHNPGAAAHCRYMEAYSGEVGLLLESKGTMLPLTISAAAASLKPKGSAIISVPEDGSYSESIVFANSNRHFHDQHGDFPDHVKQALEEMGDCKAIGIKPYTSTYSDDVGQIPLTYHYGRDLGKPAEQSVNRHEDTVQDAVSCVYSKRVDGDHLEIKVPVTCSYNKELETNPLQAYQYLDSDLGIIPTENPQATFRTATKALSDDPYRTWVQPVKIPGSMMSENGITLNQGKFQEIFSQLPKQIPETITNIGNCSSVNVYNFNPLPNGTRDKSGYRPGRIMLNFEFDNKSGSDGDDDGAST